MCTQRSREHVSPQGLPRQACRPPAHSCLRTFYHSALLLLPYSSIGKATPRPVPYSYFYSTASLLGLLRLPYIFSGNTTPKICPTAILTPPPRRVRGVCPRLGSGGMSSPVGPSLSSWLSKYEGWRCAKPTRRSCVGVWGCYRPINSVRNSTHSSICDRISRGDHTEGSHGRMAIQDTHTYIYEVFTYILPTFSFWGACLNFWREIWGAVAPLPRPVVESDSA